MNPLTLIVLAFFAYFFYSIGSTFLAFLTLAVAIIFALSSKSEPSGNQAAAAGYGPMPQQIVVGGGHPSASFPRKFEFRPNFPGDPDGDEWVSGKLGAWIVLFGRIIKKIFGTSDTKSKSHH